MTHDELHTAIRLVGWSGVIESLTPEEVAELKHVMHGAVALCSRDSHAPSVAVLRHWLEVAHNKVIELINARPEP